MKKKANLPKIILKNMSLFSNRLMFLLLFDMSFLKRQLLRSRV